MRAPPEHDALVAHINNDSSVRRVHESGKLAAFKDVDAGGLDLPRNLTRRRNRRSRIVDSILFLSLIHASSFGADSKRGSDSPSSYFQAQNGHTLAREPKFTHLTTGDGLSQSSITEILQDRQGFMWFATHDGLNRYDGNAFVVYKNDPNDPGSLSSNFLQDLTEDNEGYLWVATSTGVNRFDPRTERCTRYLHDPDNRDTLGGASVKSVIQDGHGYLWFGTEDSGLDKLDPRRGTFTHYRNDSEGRFVGRITQVIVDGRGDIWFTGERGLFHVDQQSGRVTRRPPASNALSADSVYEDAAGDLPLRYVGRPWRASRWSIECW